MLNFDDMRRKSWLFLASIYHVMDLVISTILHSVVWVSRFRSDLFVPTLMLESARNHIHTTRTLIHRVVTND